MYGDIQGDIDKMAAILAAGFGLIPVTGAERRRGFFTISSPLSYKVKGIVV